MDAAGTSCFEYERAIASREKNEQVVGINLGVHVLAATSEGQLEANRRRDYLHKQARARERPGTTALEALVLRAMTRRESRGHSGASAVAGRRSGV